MTFPNNHPPSILQYNTDRLPTLIAAKPRLNSLFSHSLFNHAKLYSGILFTVGSKLADSSRIPYSIETNLPARVAENEEISLESTVKPRVEFFSVVAEKRERERRVSRILQRILAMRGIRKTMQNVSFDRRSRVVFRNENSPVSGKRRKL